MKTVSSLLLFLSLSLSPSYWLLLRLLQCYCLWWAASEYGQTKIDWVLVLDARQSMEEVRERVMWEREGVMKSHGSLGICEHVYENNFTTPPSIDLSIRFWLCNNFSTKTYLQCSRSCQPLTSSTAASSNTRGSGATKTGLPSVPEMLLSPT